MCRAVHAAAGGVVEPDAGEVDGHVYFFAGIGIITEEPNLVVFAVDRFGPDLVDDDVGCELVLIAAVNHQFGLCIEGVSDAVSLVAREVAYRVGRGCKNR